MIGSRLARLLGALAAAAALLIPLPARAQAAPEGLGKIEHIVVIYLENRSFDHLYGHFPGANGLANAGPTAVQVDDAGQPYDALPDPLDLRRRPPARYAALPERLPNGPFRLNDHYKPGQVMGSLVHAFYEPHTTSILKLLETRFGLAPLTAADAAANDLTGAFQF